MRFAKMLLNVLLLGTFFVVVFVPIGGDFEWVVWVLLAFLLVLVWFYYLMLYWVSESQAIEVFPDEPHRFSRFAGKLTGTGAQRELVRGRLIVTLNQLVFIKKSETGYEVYWSCRLVDVETFTVSRMLGLRSGFVFTLRNGSEEKFPLFRASKRTEELKAALDWS